MNRKRLQYCYGIDFGTTNSATVGIAYIDGAKEIMMFGDEERRPVPSIVAINRETGDVYTGRQAWERRLELSQTCEIITSVKTLLDTEWEKVIAGKVWNTEMVAAEVFKCLQENVYEKSKKRIEEAVVAIPVGFPSEKRKIVRRAAKAAGIEVKSFISEPTAAFFSNYMEIRNDMNVAIFDWGGGTLDVSVLNHCKGKIYELATGGRNEAGDAIDLKLARKIHNKIARKKNINIPFDDMPLKNRDMMLVKAERAKREFYDEDTATITINNYGEMGAVKVTIDYDWFADIIENEIENAFSCFLEVVEQSKVGLANLDRIIMVGGSSNLGPIIDKFQSKFGDKLFFPDETMWNVGMGAAMLSSNPGTYFSNQKIGLRMADNSLFVLLGENQSLNGWSASHHFGIVDSNKEARFVFAGSEDLESDSDKYRTLSIPAYRFLQEQLILDTEVDENQVFNVTVSSTMRPNKYDRVWSYERLKCYYRLPEDGE